MEFKNHTYFDPRSFDAKQSCTQPLVGKKYDVSIDDYTAKLNAAQQRMIDYLNEQMYQVNSYRRNFRLDNMQ